MKIFESVVSSEDEYEWVVAVDDVDFDHLRIESPDPVTTGWVPIAVELVREDEGIHMVEADFPWLGSYALVMRPAAAAFVGRLLDGCAELLPLSTTDDDGLQLLHVTDQRDALDEDASDIVRFRSGRVMTVRDHAFRPAALEGVRCFTIPQTAGASIYVTEEIVDAITASGFTGFAAELVWEHGPR